MFFLFYHGTRPPRSTRPFPLFPDTTLCRSRGVAGADRGKQPVGEFEQREIARRMAEAVVDIFELVEVGEDDRRAFGMALEARDALMDRGQEIAAVEQDRKSTRLKSSH